jgi:TPP-dependent trihydroxycyclohexane-1,2-dione (THcHDO) dehydratase
MSMAGEYHLGQGYSVENLNVAGYVNVVADAPHDGKAEIIGDDISLFVSDSINTSTLLLKPSLPVRPFGDKVTRYWQTIIRHLC